MNETEIKTCSRCHRDVEAEVIMVSDDKLSDIIGNMYEEYFNSPFVCIGCAIDSIEGKT